MPNNERLNRQQKATVENFMSSRRGARLERIRDDSCEYRSAFIHWVKAIPGKTLVYQTRLELTPAGKIRVEETQHTDTWESVSQFGQLALPLEEKFVLPATPPKKVRHSLYPKSKDKAPKTKDKKPEQLRLPISQLGAKLLEISQSEGYPVLSEQELLSGSVQHYSLEDRRVVDLPQPVVALLKKFNATSKEWENAIDLLGVIGVAGCIRYVEQLPKIRELLPSASVAVPVVAPWAKQKSGQQQSVSISS